MSTASVSCAVTMKTSQRGWWDDVSHTPPLPVMNCLYPQALSPQTDLRFYMRATWCFLTTVNLWGIISPVNLCAHHRTIKPRVKTCFSPIMFFLPSPDVYSRSTLGFIFYDSEVELCWRSMPVTNIYNNNEVTGDVIWLIRTPLEESNM